MSFNRCSGCEAMVDTSKAYCPDCGAAMDEEQGRGGVSEYDSLMKTQNLNATAHFKILEQFNLSSVFRLPTEDADKQKSVEGEAIPPKFDKQPEARIKPKQSEKIVSAPEKTEDIKSKTTEDAAIKPPQVIENSSNSKKTLYIVLGAVLILFGAVLIFVIILGYLYWNYYR